MPKRLLALTKRHPFVLAGIVAILAVTVGWALGARAACGPGWEQCDFDTDLFGATGTWAGAIVAGFAAGWTALQVRAELSRRKEEREQAAKVQAEQDQKFLSAARNVVLRTTPSRSHNQDSVAIAVRNQTEMYVTDPVIYFDGRELKRAQLVNPTREWGDNFTLDALGVDPFPSGRDKGNYLNEHVRPRLTLAFSIGIRRYRRVGSDVEPATWSPGAVTSPSASEDGLDTKRGGAAPNGGEAVDAEAPTGG